MKDNGEKLSPIAGRVLEYLYENKGTTVISKIAFDLNLGEDLVIRASEELVRRKHISKLPPARILN